MSDIDLTDIDASVDDDEKNLPTGEQPEDEQILDENPQEELDDNSDDDSSDDGSEDKEYETDEEYLKEYGLGEHKTLDNALKALSERPQEDPRIAQLNATLAPYGGIAGVLSGGIQQQQQQQPQQNYVQPGIYQQPNQSPMGLPERPALKAAEEMARTANWTPETKAFALQFAGIMDNAMSQNVQPLLNQNAALYSGFKSVQERTSSHDYRLLPRKYREQGKKTFVPKQVLDTIITGEMNNGRQCDYEQAVNMYLMNAGINMNQPESPNRPKKSLRPTGKRPLKKKKGKSIEEIRSGIQSGAINPETLSVEVLKQVHEV